MTRSNIITITVTSGGLSLSVSGFYVNYGTDSCTSGYLINDSVYIVASGGSPPYTYEVDYSDGTVQKSSPMSGGWNTSHQACGLSSIVTGKVTDSTGLSISQVVALTKSGGPTPT